MPGPRTPRPRAQRHGDEVGGRASPQVTRAPGEPEVPPRVAGAKAVAHVAARQPEASEDDGPEDNEVRNERRAQVTEREGDRPRRHDSGGDATQGVRERPAVEHGIGFLRWCLWGAPR